MKYKECANNLKKAMADKNLTAQELSELSGVGKSSISHYVNGTHKPGVVASLKLSRVLGINPALLTMEEAIEIPFILNENTITMADKDSRLLNDIKNLIPEARTLIENLVQMLPKNQ